MTGQFVPSKLQIAIRDALQEHAHFACPLCDARQWDLPDGLVVLKLQARLGGWAFGAGSAPETSFIPCASLVCGNCGNVQLISLLVLNIPQDLLMGIR